MALTFTQPNEAWFRVVQGVFIGVNILWLSVREDKIFIAFFFFNQALSGTPTGDFLGFEGVRVVQYSGDMFY